MDYVSNCKNGPKDKKTQQKDIKKTREGVDTKGVKKLGYPAAPTNQT